MLTLESVPNHLFNGRDNSIADLPQDVLFTVDVPRNLSASTRIIGLYLSLRMISGLSRPWTCDNSRGQACDHYHYRLAGNPYAQVARLCPAAETIHPKSQPLVHCFS
jgi:hypothetical protein